METKSETRSAFRYPLVFAILALTQVLIYHYVLAPKLVQETHFEMSSSDYLHKHLGFMYSDWGQDWSFLDQRGLDDGSVAEIPSLISDN